MKKLAAILCLSAFATGAFAQGLVNFFNNPTTQISSGGTATAAVAGQYYFALLTAPAGTTDYTLFAFSGNYGTNLASLGRFTGGGNLAITGWAAGETRAYAVCGWSAAVLGHDFQSSWLANAANLPGFGVSAIGTGFAGGGAQGLPPLPVFGAAPSISSGFNIVVPEPGSIALAGLGAAAMLIFRRRK